MYTVYSRDPRAKVDGKRPGPGTVTIAEKIVSVKADSDSVISATGVLHHPNMPLIEGMETFRGHLFHSSRWNHSVALEGKRIGVIGTGSTSVQIFSALAGSAGLIFPCDARGILYTALHGLPLGEELKYQ